MKTHSTFFVVTRRLLLVVSVIVSASSCCSRRIIVSTYAGTGTAGNVNGAGHLAQFDQPVDVATDAKGNVYVADHNNDLIRIINTSDVVSLFYDWGARPSGGPDQITRLDVNDKGEAFVVDIENISIRKVFGGTSSTVSGFHRDDEYYWHYLPVDGAKDSAAFYRMSDLTLDATATNLKVIDETKAAKIIRSVTMAGFVTTMSWSFSAVGDYGSISSITADGHNNFYLAAGNRIFKVDAATGTASLLAGSTSAGYADGAGASAKFNNITSIDADKKGNVFVSDNGNNRIRKVSTTGIVSTIAGNGSVGFADGAGATAQFNDLQGIVVWKCTLYVADRGNNRIRKIRIPMP